MIVEGYCRQCNKGFDAHWHNYPEGYNMKPYCLTCKSYDVAWWTDESHEYNEPEENNFDEEDI